MDLPVTVSALIAFARAAEVDVARAGDNAVVVGLAMTGLPDQQRRPAIIMVIGGER